MGMILAPDMPHTSTWPSARFAVVNAAQFPTEYWNDLPCQPIVPEAHREQVELFPVLVDLDQLDETKHATVVERERDYAAEVGKPYLMALLASSATPASLITHLARRMVIRLQDGQEDILRFYDPLVFRHLRWLLSAEQMDSLLGPIDAWHWKEPAGVWHAHLRQADRPSIRPLRLTPGQWPSLLRMADLQRLIHRLAQHDPQHAYRIETARQLDQSLADAQSTKGLDDRQDRILFALQAQRFGRAIHQHPKIRQRLHLACIGSMTYVAACADLDDDRLQKFALELERTQ